MLLGAFLSQWGGGTSTETGEQSKSLQTEEYWSWQETPGLEAIDNSLAKQSFSSSGTTVR